MAVRRRSSKRNSRKANALTRYWRRALARLTPRMQRAAMVGALGLAAASVAALAFVLAQQLDRPKPAAPAQTATPARPPAASQSRPPTQQAALPRPPSPPADLRQPAWLRNAVAAPATHGLAMVAVVIDDMGLDRPRSMRTVDLPAPLTLSYLPYGKDLPGQTALARFKGHELMVHLPMEPSGSADPGPEALKTDLDAGELRRRIAANLAHFESYVGVNNHMGSKFTTWRPGMEIVIDEMKKRGLLFLDSRTSAQSVGAELATAAGVPNASRHVFLDDVLSSDNVWHQLGEVEKAARRNGYAIAIGHPHDNTIEALARWLPGLREKGLVLVPLTAIVRQRQGG
ncbi:MAG: divergent polysaccharide deacetylase family protein [Reyranellaceae bacterium]